MIKYNLITFFLSSLHQFFWNSVSSPCLLVPYHSSSLHHVTWLYLWWSRIAFRPALDHHPNVGINLKVNPLLLSSESSSTSCTLNSRIPRIFPYLFIISSWLGNVQSVSPPAAHPVRNNSPCVSGPDLSSCPFSPPWHSPDFNEDIQPVEEHIRNLSSESQISEEIARIIRLDTGVVLAQLVVHKVLKRGVKKKTQENWRKSENSFEPL